MTTWLDSATHRRWLDDHGRRLLEFSRRTGCPEGGAYWLDADGTPDSSRPLHTWIAARMVHVFGLGALLGVPGCVPIAERALRGLQGSLRDDVYGGWFPTSDADEAVPEGKSCYDHAFVLLAAATGTQAGLSGADQLLAVATDVFLTRFWDDRAGMCLDSWDRKFTIPADYRGLNANMHAVEAMLSVASLTNDPMWLQRAARVVTFVTRSAAGHGWRIPEHYDSRWRSLPEYNRKQKAHQFKPYGATVGHALEWARLLLHLDGAGRDDTGILVEAAVALFDRAVRDGWSRDGNPGFVYTTDWDGVPVVRDRMHWVLAEAINTASALYRRTGDAKYAKWYARWWDHADAYHIDHVRGSWIHQLDATNAPAESIWSGKPDTYHAFQATLVPRLPLYPMVSAAVAHGALE